MSIPPPFALFYPQNHPFAVHIGDLQVGNLAGTQTSAIGHTQCCLNF